MPKNININQILQQIPGLLPNYCDRCGMKHDKSDLEIVSQDNEKVVCRLGCTKCGSSYMIHINSPVDGIVAAKKSAYKVDVSPAEIKKFSLTEEINQDEILDVFIALKDVATIQDFNILFGSE